MGLQPKLHGTLKKEDNLGRGATANVFRSTAISPQPLALKLSCPGMVSPEIIKRLFVKEANFLTKFDHPNIPKVHGIGEYYDPSFRTEEGIAPLPFIAFELVKGKPLSDYVGSSQQFPVLRALKAIKGVVSALQALHDKGYIHGDIKPENVMFDSLTDHATLIDFSAPQAENSPQKKAVGTVHYMSIERMGGKDFDRTSDIYSLGLTLYEILMGKRAFPHVARNYSEYKEQHGYFKNDLESSDLPDSVKGLIVRMAYFEDSKTFGKEERFRNCYDLMDAVDRVIEKLEVEKTASAHVA